MTTQSAAVTSSRIQVINTEDVTCDTVGAVTGFPNGVRATVIRGCACKNQARHAFLYRSCCFIALNLAVVSLHILLFDETALFYRGKTQFTLIKCHESACLRRSACPAPSRARRH
jgi:hypothetical protein